MTDFDVLQETGLTMEEYLDRCRSNHFTSIVDNITKERNLEDGFLPNATLGEELELLYGSEEDMDDEDWDEQDDGYGYSGNMPCDTYGMCAGTSCSHYWQCNQFRKR